MTGARTRWTTAVSALAISAVLVVGCSSNTSPTDSASGSSGPATTAPAAGPLKILVTNDDGYDAKGIDAVVEGLRALPDTQVTVVAPLTNQSGVGGKTTAGTLTATDVKTLSGYPAKAVAGTPADTITWAIDQHGIDFTPDVVISGINFGPNIGTAVGISGTVGAARAAAARGIPALATSQGLGDPADFPTGVAATLSWLSVQRGSLGTGKDKAPVLLENLNTPTCTSGSARPLVEVPIASGEDITRDLGPSDCTSTAIDPADDVTAFGEGFVVLSTLPLTQPTTP